MSTHYRDSALYLLFWLRFGSPLRCRKVFLHPINKLTTMTSNRLSEAITQHFDVHQKGYFPDGGRQKKKISMIDNVHSSAELLLQHFSTVEEGAVDMAEDKMLWCVETALPALSTSAADDEVLVRFLNLASVFSFKFSPSGFSGIWNIATQLLQSTIVPSLRCKRCYLIGELPCTLCCHSCMSIRLYQRVPAIAVASPLALQN